MEESSNISLSLTAKETEMLAAVVLSMDEFPKVDFNKVGSFVGIKHGKNARAKFNAVWDKIKKAGSDNVSVQSAGQGAEQNSGSDGDGEAKPNVTPTKKGPVNKKGTARATPRKNAAGVTKTPRKNAKAAKSKEVVEAVLNEGNGEEAIPSVESEGEA